MRKIYIILVCFFVASLLHINLSFAGGNGFNVWPNAVKVECVNITGRTSNKLIDICCVDSYFYITDCLGNYAPPFDGENAARTCLAGQNIVFTPTFIPYSPCDSE